MSSRGVRKHGAALATRQFRGVFEADEAARRDVLTALGA
jgi:GTP cyclohydrolase I